MLPVAIAIGAIFHNWMGYLTFLSPYLIFAMLFFPYCKLRLADLKITKMETHLLAIQLALSALFYFLLLPLDKIVAEGIFICIFVPTATAAPVITSMLGGNLSRVASYSLLCNLCIAAIGPLVLSWVGERADLSFLSSFFLILRQVVPLLIGPLLLAMLFRRLCPSLHKKIESHQSISFYLWAISLVIIVGSCVSFAIRQWQPQNAILIILLCLGALIACLIQFVIGRRFGRINGDPVSGGQALMQKNTVLAVWLALAYLNPLSSIAPAAYIGWQNIINSWQIMKHKSAR